MTATSPHERHEAGCDEVRAELSAYLDGELELRRRAPLERHLRRCPRCRRLLTNLRRTVLGLRRLRGRPVVRDPVVGD